MSRVGSRSLRIRETKCVLYRWSVLCVFSLLGCQQEVFKAETEILPDGRIRRAILQTEAFPENKKWQKTWRTDSEWSGKIEHSPKVTDIKEKSANSIAFVGVGTFLNASEIPNHFHFERKANDRLFKSQLVSNSRTINHGFVTEFIWEETLTDVVSLSDMRHARRELFDLCLPVMRKTLESSHLNQYQWKPLINWMDREGREWLFEVIDLQYEYSIQIENNPTELEERFYKCCKKRGLKLTREMSNQERKDAVAEFADTMLQRLVKTPSGKAMTAADRQELLTGLLLKDSRDESIREQWDDYVKKVIETYHPGGQEAFNERIQELVVRIMGIYFFTGSRKFNYSVKVPGKILSTNGNIDSEHEVSWAFSAGDAYPHGYRMTVQSAAVVDQTLSKLLGKAALDNQRKIREYMKIIGKLRSDFQNDNSLNVDDLFAEMRKEKSLKPLENLQGTLSSVPEMKESAALLDDLNKLIYGSE